MKKIAFLSLLSLLIFSCSKPGCTDPSAKNYNISAKKNDGSCTYQTKLIFWQDLTAANSWAPLGVTSLKYYVNGVYIGSSLANEYYSTQPSCAASGQASYTIDLGKNTSGSVHVQVIDQSDFTWYDEYVTVYNDECSYYRVF
ncbi:MAG: hypothetical protein KA736_02315 [Crocinitomicaceae bacterium]|nr:hypothetical protein [Crocinitomicaceae bacterium]MBP6032516.1 hypothetical protein [Crocinitomicaceae bacterium]